MDDIYSHDRVIADLRDIKRNFREQGYPYKYPLYLYYSKTYDTDAVFRSALLSVLLERDSDAVVAEPIHAIIWDANKHSHADQCAMVSLYQRSDDNRPYISNTIQSLALMTAHVSQIRGEKINIIMRSWRHSLKFCEAILNRHKKYDVNILMQACDYIHYLHATASPDDIAATLSTYEAYSEIMKEYGVNFGNMHSSG